MKPNDAYGRGRPNYLPSCQLRCAYATIPKGPNDARKGHRAPQCLLIPERLKPHSRVVDLWFLLAIIRLS